MRFLDVVQFQDFSDLPVTEPGLDSGQRTKRHSETLKDQRFISHQQAQEKVISPGLSPETQTKGVFYTLVLLYLCHPCSWGQ